LLPRIYNVVKSPDKTQKLTKGYNPEKSASCFEIAKFAPKVKNQHILKKNTFSNGAATQNALQKLFLSQTSIF